MARRRSVNQRTIDRLREFTEALERDETISTRFTCRKIVLDLRPEPYSPELVKDTRKLLGVSQALFAQLLGVKISRLQKWERGINPVPDIACRFMDEIRRQPKYWKKRLRESVRITA